MRIILIILSILALVFVGGISYSLMSSENGWKISTKSDMTEIIASKDSITLDTWKNQIKTEEKLNRLTEMVEEIAKKNGTYRNEDTNTGAEKVEPPVKPVVKPSGKFLALMMPTITPVLVENNGIY
jgi:hypothetical protein